ncbi:queuosine precursor transporter [Roseivirga sp.]|uniref:queuosine precursor transporter n=1 Tax=Roseivirga sp. TaxID=1964215 RepID=UPI002B26E4B5|nr:queuosine precursor transporter [Roseivirga sp.]
MSTDNKNRKKKPDQQGVKYLHIVSMLFITSLLVSSILSIKVITLGFLDAPAGIITFPIAFISGDILTEVYGFKIAKRVIWVGLFCQLLMSVMFLIGDALPYPAYWSLQSEFSAIVGFVPRVVAGGMVAYFMGEYLNAMVMSKMKIWDQGKRFWLRALSSSLLGQGLNSITFTFIAFYGIYSVDQLLILIGSGVLTKMIYEIIALPLTSYITKWLKRNEGMDTYDYDVEYGIV